MSSMYDRVKVRVHLDGDQCYILSRFMLSKMLRFCKLPTTAAVQVSLELKKFLVVQGKLDVAQDELEAAIFHIMAQYGYGDAHTSLFPLMTRFYMERVPLIILIAGSGCCSKTFIAHSLASTLNTHNVVNTDLLLDTLTAVHASFPADCIAAAGIPNHNSNSNDDSNGWPKPDERGLWFRTDDDDSNSTSNNNDAGLLSLLGVWRVWASAVRPLVASELEKAVAEGKVLIVEGSLLDLAQYRTYLYRRYQRRHGAIAVALYVSTDDALRRFLVERFLASHPELLPSFFQYDNKGDVQPESDDRNECGYDGSDENGNGFTAAAVEWMMQRLKAVEAAQLKILAEKNNHMALRRMDKGQGAQLPDAPSSGSGKTDNNNNNNSWDVEEEETVYVNLVSYSVGALTKPHEVMHELVLERIRAELHQRQLAQEMQSQSAAAEATAKEESLSA